MATAFAGNFRSTLGFVTDGAGEVAVFGTDSYPTTRGGYTYGWSTTLSDRDRDSGIDRRLAGVNFTGSATLRVDLPATGDYTVRLAMGDAGSLQVSQTIVFQDTSSSLLTIGPHTTNAAEFYDASDVNRTAANWPGSNVAATLTFATTILNLVLSAPSACAIAHLFVDQAAGVAKRYLLVRN